MVANLAEDVAAWIPDRPLALTTDAGDWCRRGDALLARLPPRARRSADDRRWAERVQMAMRDFRAAVLTEHAEAIFLAATGEGRDVGRVEELVYWAAERFPGLVPTLASVLAERARPQKDKEGIELDQGVFLAHMLAHPRIGAHLVQSMRRAKPGSLNLLPSFTATGVADLGSAHLRREGRVGHLHITNPAFLNAEDDALLEALETGVDLVLLDPQIEVGVLRGGIVDHPKYQGRRVFCSGINLTHLYEGQLSFLYYVVRELGLVNKIYRGLANTDVPENDLVHCAAEKPWIAAVETHAIGGGVQMILVADQVLAEEGSFFTVPARNEGFIPGLANLRLPRVVGHRLARQMIYFNHKIMADSPEGRLLVDEVVPRGEMDSAIERTVDTLLGSGLSGLAGNRRAFRIGEEPLETFRAYMASFSIEQAVCLFSPELIENLERHWTSRHRDDVKRETR